MSRPSPTISTILTLLLLHTLPVYSFSCTISTSSLKYDITPLSGLRSAEKQTSTPPTTNDAKATLNLCDEGGVPYDDNLSDEDQCPEGTRLCLRIVNHKPSVEDPDRTTAVIPFWKVDTSDDDIWTTPLGNKGEDGLKIYVQGPEYAGTPQNMNLTLLCSEGATDSNPTFLSYSNGLLSLEWATPEGCPRSGDYEPEDGNGSSGSNSGSWGFFGFIKFLFWAAVIGLILYFAIGMFYNHQQYSAKGWDLLPHRDFWREFPVLVQDLFSHVFAGLRGGSGGGGRGGYNSLG